MPSPSEPERYSIDEMMDRLKNRPDEQPLEDGELVVRADGSQAIKVRKRKRRSHQPHKEMLLKSRRRRMIQVSAALLALLTLALLAGAAIVYANSAPFRSKFIRMIGEASGADVRLEEFRVNPSRAVAGSLVLNWPEDRLMRELAMRGVSAAVPPSFFAGASIHGEELVCRDASILLANPTAETPVARPPGSVHFKRYAISRLRVTLGDPQKPFGSLFQSEATYEVEGKNGRPQLLLNRGSVLLTGWPAYRLDRAHLEFHAREIDVVSMTLMPEADNDGVMELAGTLRPVATDQKSTLEIRAESFPLAGILGPEIGRMFDGRVNTRTRPESNVLSFTRESDAVLGLDLSVEQTPGSTFSIRGLPFLAHLSLMLADKWFEQPVFEDGVSATLRRDRSGISVADLAAEQRARMSLRGSILLTTERHLAGKLEVGLSEAMIRASGHPKLNTAFGPVEEGFRWLTIDVSGHSVKPVDNFIEILDAARPAPRGQASAVEERVPTFEELTAPE